MEDNTFHTQASGSKNPHPLVSQFLTPEFLKQFKDSKDLNTFIDELFTKGMEQMLEGELEAHLGYTKHSTTGYNSGNSRNGKTLKTVKTRRGDFLIEVPRDRNSTFQPVLVPKRSRFIDGIEEVIISLYARGMSVRDIETQIREIYGVNVSDATISNVTAKIHSSILEWQNRPLAPVYYVLWLDGIIFKVRQNGRVINKTLYLAVGLNSEGYRDVLGMWLGENESASFWVTVLTDLKSRGVEDILISCTDNLKGFTDAINSVFKQAVTQICVVHQIRNSLKFVVWKDKGKFTQGLRAIYNAPNKQVALSALQELETIWGKKYPHAIKSWKENWDNLTHFFDYHHEIRKIIYTTNLIEGLNGQIRKYTNNKLSFPDDQSVFKAVYLALREITKKWSRVPPDWILMANQFLILFEGRAKT